MNYIEITYSKEKALDLERFREMDYYAVENYNLPIELMMENAGLQLANLIGNSSELNQVILIGVGNGNNGGGGLVAARRLVAWGYDVYLDIPVEITKELPKKQFKRAIDFGVKSTSIENPDVWVDAYLGFSQRLPIDEKFALRVEAANKSSALKIALDIPTGFLGNIEEIYFKADKVITLAAPKDILYNLDLNTEIYIADLGIPKKIYSEFEMEIPPFQTNNILKLKRK